MASVGDATNTDEYVPISMPMSNAIANSLNVEAPSTPEPITKRAITGSTDEIDVFVDRMST